MHRSAGWQKSIRNRPEMYLRTVDWNGIEDVVHLFVNELIQETGAREINTITDSDRRVTISLTNCSRGLRGGWEQYSTRMKPWNKTEFHTLNAISANSILEQFREDGRLNGRLEFDHGILVGEERPGLQIPARVEISFRFSIF